MTPGLSALPASGSSPLVTAVIAIAVALLASSLIAVAIKSKSGKLRAGPGGADEAQAPPGIALSATGPTIVHFSAVWCGPCAAVRRVVDQVSAEQPEVAHIEVDIDANPDAARTLSVLSLPTTFIFDASGRQAYRVSGVPKAADLRTALQGLTQPG
ncbi:thiol reductase thioredoxin [Mycobacteroides chelonae]|jgi:thiol-disulfide isomerase/thioredoxin|nr:thioredoxin family protein [Mycobacteroides chelonae]KRQ30575.1 thioredoxin [Mycobacteroides sp. H072]KRQ32104.1 thioredoxin [Mycobacteroides sp. H002]KRQ50011.1 thioredoxin [Mycobacteroides sp. H054]KRQ67379.1 thioredoxin [Mycobacteroides sp. H001]OHU34662.1 thiol reductase thioredoxin [Mycobacteroides chelonae]